MATRTLSLDNLTERQVVLLRVLSRNRIIRSIRDRGCFLVDGETRSRGRRVSHEDVRALCDLGLLTVASRRGPDTTLALVRAGRSIAIAIGRAESLA